MRSAARELDGLGSAGLVYPGLPSEDEGQQGLPPSLCCKVTMSDQNLGGRRMSRAHSQNS